MTSPTQRQDLLPCPFCCAEIRREDYEGEHYAVHGVVTDECPMAGRLITIDKWNTRAHPENTGEELRTLKNLLITYQEALEFYADKKNWIGQWHPECNQPVSNIDFDEGSRARAVLTPQKGTPHPKDDE